MLLEFVVKTLFWSAIGTIAFFFYKVMGFMERGKEDERRKGKRDFDFFIVWVATTQLFSR